MTVLQELPQQDYIAWLESAVDTHDAAPLSGHSEQTLRTMRVRGSGPPFIKVGKSVRYVVRDLIEYREAHRCRSTAEYRGKTDPGDGEK